MELVARPWLIYEMTDSVFLLGAIQAVRGLPVILFSGIGGILADRFDRTGLLAATKALNALSLLAVTVLLLAGHLEVWHVFAATLLAGISNAMEFPIRQAMVPGLVPKPVLMNAVALSQITRQLAHVAAPSLAGALIAVIGIGGCYVVQTVLALMTVAIPNLIDAPKGSQLARHESVVQNIIGALTYVRHNEVVLTLLVLAIAPNLFLRAWQPTLAVFARDILDVGEVGFGLLNSATGLGALMGATVIALLGHVRRKGTILLVGLLLQAVGLILFAFSQWFPLSLALIAFVGIVQTAYFSMNGALLLTHVDEPYRGRVLSIYDTDRGLIPLGALLLGALATWLGTPEALALLALPIIPITLIVLWRVPRFRATE